MSKKNILNYKDWGSKIFEQEQPTTAPAADSIKHTAAVGGKTITFLLNIGTNKETKATYPSSLQILTEDGNFLAKRDTGNIFNFPSDMKGFIEKLVAFQPTNEGGSVAGAFKAFKAAAAEGGHELKFSSNFEKFLNGEYLSMGPGYRLKTTYTVSKDAVSVVPDGYGTYTFKFTPYDVHNADSKEVIGTNVSRQVFVSNDKGTTTSYMMKSTLYGKSFGLIDEKSTAFATLTPKTPYDITKLQKVVRRDHIIADWFWEKVGKALKAELDKLA